MESSIGQQLMNGLALGCMYALIALGYTLIFGVMRLIFFAQGELCMLGAYGALGLAAVCSGRLKGGGLVFLSLALAAAVAAPVVAGIFAERFTLRPLREAPRTKQLIASIGVSLFLQNLIMLVVGPESIPFPPFFSEAVWRVGAILVTPVQVFIIVGSLVLMWISHWLLHNTKMGLCIRAVAENAEVAQLDGINVNRVVTETFILGSMLAGFAGFCLGSYSGVAKYNMGFLPGIKGFTAAIVGGFGQPGGAMLGGLVLGLAESLAAGYISGAYKDVLSFAVLILVLVVRPVGLLGKAETRR